MKKILAILCSISVLLGTGYAYENDYNCCYNQDCCYGNFTVGGDWLYWKVSEAKLDYGAGLREVGTNTTSKILRPAFKYDSGYRVFLNYETCDQCWNINAAYTHISTNARKNFNGTASLNFEFATLFNVNSPLMLALSLNPLASLNSHWDEEFNYIDLDVSRTFTCCDSLLVIPHIGIRGAWSDQSLRLRGANSSFSFTTHLKSRFASIGLEGGVKLDWRLYDGLSLIGHVGGSILYTRFHNHGVFDLDVIGISTFDFASKDTFYRGIPMFDSFIGLNYNSCYCNYAFNVHIGWEHHVVYETNTYFATGFGNTTMQGLTLGAAVSF